MNRMTYVLGMILVVILVSVSLAAIPKLINYQGMLTDNSGTPLAGSYNLTFKIWTDTTDGSSLWTETQNGVQVTNGLFNVILGRLTALNLAFDQQYWLEVKVGDETMPRIRFTSVGYAYRAAIADSATVAVSAPSGGGWTDDGTNVRLTTSTDKVGIGTSTPETYSKLHIVVPRTQSFDRVTIECPRDSNGFGIELKQPGGYWRLGQNVGNGWKDYFTITNNVSPYYRFTILSDGRTGIGTVDAAYKLDVRGDRIQLKEDATSDSIALRTDGAAVDLSFGGANLWIQSSTAGEHVLLNPTASNKVGIGTTTPGAKLDISSSSGLALRAVNTSASGWGIDASAKEGGGHIFDSDGSGNAYIAHGHTGVEAYGNDQGGYFQDANNGAYAHVGYGNRGIEAKGTDAGGYFEDSDGEGYALVGSGDHGILAHGSYAGGFFNSIHTSADARVAFITYKISGTGSVSFIQNHPYNEDQVIVYAAPEGDEVATYTRGTARLVNGETRVMLGETFKLVTNPDVGLTAHITPRGECEGLYVASLTTSEMVVKELRSGTSNTEFDYLVYGLRIGFEETSVVQKKTEEAYIPSMKDHQEMYNRYPELRHFNSLERFRQMYSQIGKPFDLGTSQVLRDAIHEFDPAIDKIPDH